MYAICFSLLSGYVLYCIFVLAFMSLLSVFKATSLDMAFLVAVHYVIFYCFLFCMQVWRINSSSSSSVHIGASALSSIIWY